MSALNLKSVLKESMLLKNPTYVADKSEILDTLGMSKTKTILKNRERNFKITSQSKTHAPL